MSIALLMRTNMEFCAVGEHRAQTLEWPTDSTRSQHDPLT